MSNLKESIVRERFQKSKTKRDHLYRNSLIIITGLVVFLLLSFIILLIAKGISGFFQFDELTFGEFLFGNYYNPTSLAFSAGFMIVNTIWISFLALLIAVPISVFTALFVTKIIPERFKSPFIVIISILAAVPSVIYGAFGMFIINDIVSTIFGVPPGVALSVVVTLAFMIMPTITILSISSIESVDKKLQDSSIALGATKTQTSLHVTLRSASKGILVAVLLGLGRAVGEATAVSMVASQASYGPNFNPFGFTTLITATMLLGFQEAAAGSVNQASMFSMASLLLVTILIVFIVMKILEIRVDIENRSKRASKKIFQKAKIYEKLDQSDVSSLSNKELIIYTKDISRKQTALNEKNHWDLSYRIASVKSFNSYKGNENIKSSKFKNRQTTIVNSLTFFLSLIGIFLLLAIILFLFIGGFNQLSWDYISTSGVYKVEDGQTVYGLATPIFGTLLTVIIALSVSLTLGIIIAITTSIYIKKNSKFSHFVSIIVQVLTGIPSLIYGIIGTIIFVPLFANDVIQLNSFSAAFTISLFVLPTILKTTQEGFDSIPSQQSSASLSLGGTNWITTRKVLFKQALPSIISSAVIATGLIIADSAIFITIYGTISQSSSSDWLHSGGTTLSSEIYKLTQQETVLWDYVKAIGIVIMFLIVLISTLANYVRNRKWKESLTLLSGMIIMFIGIFTALLSLFIIGIIVICFAIIVFTIWNYLDKKFRINTKIQSKYYEFKGGI